MHAPLDDRAQPSGPPDGAENGKRRPRRDTAGAGHDHDRDGRAHVPGDQERERCGPEGEIDQVTCHAIGKALNRRT